jgi:hypothetical protein
MDKIFINIAAYRDPLLLRTLHEALDNADNPNDLIFGIGMQYEEEIYPDLSFVPQEQLRIIKYDIDNRPGVTKIRHEISSIAYNNEKYFLMIDSHTKFEMGWDTWLKESLDNLGEKSIISGLGHIENGKILLAKSIVEQGRRELAFVRQNYLQDINDDDIGSFIRCPYIVCGFMFTYGSFVRDVGFDEYSQFGSEEPYLSWRAFMSGWDIYHTSYWPIVHAPDEYYEAAWGGHENRTFLRKESESIFKIHRLVQQSLAYVYNDYSIYAIKNPKRQPIDWFLANGHTKSDYSKIKDYFDKMIHNQPTDYDIILL